MTTPHARRSSPLLYPAVFLSLASLAWTTWSLVDLLGTGWIGFTVAAGSDVVWGSVIIAEARGLRIAGRSWTVPLLGWITLLVVAAFLASHGIARDSIAMAAAGPFLPFGAKVVWALALADMRDPATLTHDELHKLAGMERGMVFEEREHDIQMRQQRMRAELLMSQVSTDFDIEVMRQDRARELRHRAPLILPPAAVTSFDRSAEQAIEVAQEGGPAPLEAQQKPRKRQPPAAPAGPPGEVVEDASVLYESAHAPVVYFLRNGTRVKIGTSQNLRRRITSLSLRREDVIRVEHGDQQYERSLHRRFEDLRVDETEWFELRSALAEYLGLLTADSASGHPDAGADTALDTSGQPDREPDTTSGQNNGETGPEPMTSPDTHPDSPDPLSVIAEAAAGPSDLVRSLAAHGVPKDTLVSEAVRLRPDMVADSIRRTAKRLGEGPYL